MHTINAASGRNIRDNLPSVDDAEGQSIAARSAKRVLGYTIAIGVFRQLNEQRPGSGVISLQDERISYNHNHGLP